MQGSKLFVGNLSYSVDKSELEDLFTPYGTVRSVDIIPNKGFGFVEMSSSSEAESAAEALNFSSMSGRNISVSEARPQKERPRRTFRRY